MSTIGSGVLGVVQGQAPGKGTAGHGHAAGHTERVTGFERWQVRHCPPPLMFHPMAVSMPITAETTTSM